MNLRNFHSRVREGLIFWNLGTILKHNVRRITLANLSAPVDTVAMAHLPRLLVLILFRIRISSPTLEKGKVLPIVPKRIEHLMLNHMNFDTKDLTMLLLFLPAWGSIQLKPDFKLVPAENPNQDDDIFSAPRISKGMKALSPRKFSLGTVRSTEYDLFAQVFQRFIISDTLLELRLQRIRRNQATAAGAFISEFARNISTLKMNLRTCLQTKCE